MALAQCAHAGGGVRGRTYTAHVLKRFGRETGQMCGQAFTNTSADLNKRGLVFTLNARCMQFIMTENQQQPKYLHYRHMQIQLEVF